MITLVVDCNARSINLPLMDTMNEMSAGCLPENPIYLPFKGISRRHFSLFKKKEIWWIRDLGSTNGTSLNGKVIIESPIRHGDFIQAGTLRIRIEASEDDAYPIQPLCEESIADETQGTDRVSVVPVRGVDPIPSLSNLVFPPDLVPCKSAEMMDVYQKIHSICKSNTNVMLIGETGTGKEMMANMIHLSSNRRDKPFIAINCAAIPENLAEAELFGIGEKVATNVSQRKGKMMLADQGTLFLDELSAFPYALQAKILRAVQDKCITPIGQSSAIPVDFRLISATNQEPSELVRDQKLREDLYHRLATVEIDLPPLRERKEDLEVMIPVLLYRIAKSENKRLSGISKRLMTELMQYSYPGNVRELINILRSIAALAHPGEIVDVHLLPEKMLKPASVSISVPHTFGEKPHDINQTLNEVRSELIIQALELYGGNVKKAADHLNLTPFGLRKMINRLGIKKNKALYSLNPRLL